MSCRCKKSKNGLLSAHLQRRLCKCCNILSLSPAKLDTFVMSFSYSALHIRDRLRNKLIQVKPIIFDIWVGTPVSVTCWAICFRNIYRIHPAILLNNVGPLYSRSPLCKGSIFYRLVSVIQVVVYIQVHAFKTAVVDSRKL